MDHLHELGAGDLPLLFIGNFIDESRILDRISGAEEQKAFAG
jgi:hypothetical protein